MDSGTVLKALNASQIRIAGRSLEFRHDESRDNGERLSVDLKPKVSLRVALPNRKHPYPMIWWQDGTSSHDVDAHMNAINEHTSRAVRLADERSPRLVHDHLYGKQRGASPTVEELVELTCELVRAVSLAAPALVGGRAGAAAPEKESNGLDLPAVRVRSLEKRKLESWLFDPAALHEADAEHERVVAEWIQQLNDSDPHGPAAGEPLFDIGWFEDGQRWIGEVKSIKLDGSNEADQLRRAVGQLLDYAEALAALEREAARPEARIRMAILLRHRPAGRWYRICQSARIEIRSLPGDGGSQDLARIA